MGLWDKLSRWGESQSSTSLSAPKPDARMERVTRPLSFSLEGPSDFLGGADSLDGPLEPRVGREQAMTAPPVKRARDLICGTLGSLPIRVHNKKRETVPNDLFVQPELDIARSVTMTRTIEDMLFEGRSWWRITGFDWTGYPTKIVRLEPHSVTIMKNLKVYVSTDTGMTQGARWEFVPDSDLIRIDSPNDPLLVAGARAIRDYLRLSRTSARYVKEPLPLGYFSPADGMEDPTEDEVQDVLDEWAVANQQRTWGYVGKALKANPLQWSPEQLQLASQRTEAALEIARLTGLDPEDLGINTTSRTYQNAEMRRLDLLDFTLKAYVTAVEDRLSMGDVLPSTHFARYQFDGFLRSDTESRMNVYKIGREVGVYDDERIAEAENIPSAKVPTPPKAPVPPAAAAPAVPVPQEKPVPKQVKQSAEPSVTFSDADTGSLAIGFELAEAAASFSVDSTTRTVSGVAVPWGVVAKSAGRKWKFAPGSLHWGGDSTRVKLNRDHCREESFGYAATLESVDVGLSSAFKIARGEDGDEMLNLAQDRVYDGFSVEVDFDGLADGWEPDPDDETVCLVHSATLRAVALTAMPAFDGARVASVAASREEVPMSAPVAPAPATPPPVPAAPEPAQPAAPDFAEFTAGLTESIGTAVAQAFAALPMPQAPPEGRQVIPAGRAATVIEGPVYRMNGSGPSMVRDAWKARTEGDGDARDRLRKFQAQTEDIAEQAQSVNFAAASTSNAAAVIPPGYRPDLYVTQLMQGRPLVSAVSRGGLSDATPFTVPRFTSATGMSATHVEGTNPTVGTLNVGTVTVTPGAISGLFQLTREIVDSSNPAIDAIAMQSMQESYSQQTEVKVYAELNGANGQGGVITSGTVPSGAQVTTTAGGSAAASTFGGEKLIPGIRAAAALYPFKRFAAPNRMLLSSEGTSALSGAVDTTGRPLLPSVGAQNTSGVGNAFTQGWFVDGLPAQPAWSMSGNAAGDADVLLFNSNDVWFWESGLLTFRFEERSGPALIDLALFGYSATRLLRPVGLAAIRHTVGA